MLYAAKGRLEKENLVFKHLRSLNFAQFMRHCVLIGGTQRRTLSFILPDGNRTQNRRAYIQTLRQYSPVENLE